MQRRINGRRTPGRARISWLKNLRQWIGKTLYDIQITIAKGDMIVQEEDKLKSLFIFNYILKNVTLNEMNLVFLKRSYDSGEDNEIIYYKSYIVANNV